MGFLQGNLALTPRKTKEVAYKTLVRPQLEDAAPIWHPYDETQIQQVEKVQRTAVRWTCRRWKKQVVPATCWTNMSDHPWRPSLKFFDKIHSGTVYLQKDKYLTPAPNLRRTRAFHESQYTRYLARPLRS